MPYRISITDHRVMTGEICKKSANVLFRSRTGRVAFCGNGRRRHPSTPDRWRGREVYRFDAERESVPPNGLPFRWPFVESVCGTGGQNGGPLSTVVGGAHPFFDKKDPETIDLAFQASGKRANRPAVSSLFMLRVMRWMRRA